MVEFNRENLEHVQYFLEIINKHKDPQSGRVPWKIVVPIMDAKFAPKSADGYRGQYRLITNEAYKTQRKFSIAKRDHKRQDLFEVEARLVRYLRKPRSLTFLVEFLRMDEIQILGMISYLEARHAHKVSKWDEDGELMFHIAHKPISNDENYIIDYEFDEVLKVGAISDVHMCNIATDMDLLNVVYDEFQEQGVEIVLCAGDVFDGRYMNRPQQLDELVHGCHSFDGQLKYGAENFPSREGIKTYTISGNHDHTFIKNAGANIVKALADKRDDIVYLGQNKAKIDVGGVEFMLRHPVDGTTKYWSGKLQQRIDGILNSGDKSDVILVGHYHKMVNMMYRGVFGYMLPSFTNQTPFMSDNDLVSQVGGLILTIKKKDNRIVSISHEWVGMASNIY